MRNAMLGASKALITTKVVDFQIIKEYNSVSCAAFVNTAREFQAHYCIVRYTMIP
jgi:hypothetical protein